MALHEQPGKSDEWYTPPHVFTALDCEFDMDVASPGGAITPWIEAREFITEDSLSRQWKGFLWMNPPFGGRNGLKPWLQKFAHHNNGVALVPDRTSAPWWQVFVGRAQHVLFVAPKLKFIDQNGESGRSPPNGTCLVGFGYKAYRALKNAQCAGLGLLARIGG